MGFCGCSLYASTVTAVVFGIIFSIIGCIWTGIVYFGPDWILSQLAESANSTTTVKNLKNIYLGLLAIRLTDNVAENLITTLFAFHIAWFVSSFMLIFGNVKKVKWILNLWVIETSVILVVDTGATSFFVYRAVHCVLATEKLNWENIFEIRQICFLSYVTLAILSHKGVLIIFSILISLTIYVSRHAKEMSIKQNRKVDNQKSYQGYNEVTRPLYAEYPGKPHHNYGRPPEISHHQYNEYSGQVRPSHGPPPEYFPPEYETNQDMAFNYPSMRRSIYDQPYVHPSNMQPSRGTHVNRFQMHAERQPSPIPYRNKPYEYGMNREPDPDYEVERDPNRRGMQQHRY